MEKKTVAIRIRTDILEKIRVIAETEGRTANGQMKHWIYEKFEEHKNKSKLS